MRPLESELIDLSVFTETRSALGPNFNRILGYLREDGIQSVAKIEEAMRASDPAAMVLAAHKLKGEAFQFGAMRLGGAAEAIEMTARDCVEHHETPDEVIELVAALRPLFEETVAVLEKSAKPVVQQRPRGFGRRTS